MSSSGCESRLLLEGRWPQRPHLDAAPTGLPRSPVRENGDLPARGGRTAKREKADLPRTTATRAGSVAPRVPFRNGNDVGLAENHFR